ncbi:MAG: hypothetical protein PSV36_10775 [Algoriphagus sp.]|nr:hypothetical protein [Algoriphagus sp.]
MTAIFAFIAFFFFAYRLIKRIGKGFPIFELVVTLYLLQYVITAHLEYSWNWENTMAVEESEYLLFALLAVLSFAFGLLKVKNKIEIKQFYIPSNLASKLGRALVLIGFAGDVGMIILPDTVHSILNFFTLFKTIGVYALIFSEKKLDKIIIAVFTLQIALSAILNALLIEFIVFGIFFAMFYTIKYKISNPIKYGFIVASFLFITIYQGVKADYRKLVWENEVSFSDKIAILGSLISFESFSDATSSNVQDNESLLQTIHRLNQGWQTSKVIDQVPAVVPFQNGAEFVNDMISSFVPRFLWPNKRTVNDYQRFNYFTGYSLNSRTAMSIGVIGDFYINFGKIGTCLMMFVFGLSIAKLSKWFFRKFIFTNPINLIWLPFIFSYLIRPGNEFYMVVNHLIKALVVLWFVFKVIYPKLNLMKYYWIDYYKSQEVMIE